MALVLEIRTTSKKAAAEIKALATKAGASVKTLEKQSVSSSKRITASFGRLSGVLGALGLGLGLAAVGRGLKTVVSLASDTEESMNKVKEVFGEASTAVIKFSDDAATSLGASKQQALAMTGEIGNLLVAMKFSENQAGDFSTKMVQLAADLGSFNNVPTVDALNAIRSALVGESEPIRRFGADVRQTRLDQIALGLGLEFTKGKMSAQVKALAAMEAIMQDTRKAQGDFARTSDGLANSTKILAANFNDLAANIGQKLLPVVNEAVLAMNALFFDVESNAVKTKKLTAEISQLEAQIKRAGLESKSSKETLGGFFGAIDDGIRALGRFTGVGELSSEQLAEWEKRLIAAKKELKELNTVVKTNINLTVAGAGDTLKDRAKDLQFIINLEKTGARILMESSELGRIVAQSGKDRVTTNAKIVEQQEKSIELQKIGGEESQLLLNTQAILLTTAEQWALSLQSSLTFFQGMDKFGKSLLRSVENIASQLAGKAFSAFLLSLLPGGGGFLSSFRGLIGLQGGGSFKIPGPSTGADSQLVAFRGSPGETVNVTPAGKSTISNDNRVVNLNFNIVGSNIQQIKTQLIPDLRRALREEGLSLA